jgi:hypothetical protein
MENTDDKKPMNLFEKIINGIADAVRIPIRRRATRVNFVSGYNDLLKQKTDAQARRMEHLSKLENMDTEEFLKECDIIRGCSNAIEDLKEGFKELFNEDMPEDI